MTFDPATQGELAAHALLTKAHHAPTVDTTCNGGPCDGKFFTNVKAVAGDSATGFFASGRVEEPRIDEAIARDAEVTAATGPVRDTQRTQLLCRGGALRYVDMGDGTVWDCQQNLQWLKEMNCLGDHGWDEAMGSVLDDFNAGVTGQSCAEYTPGALSDWRLATKGEWTAAMADAVSLGCTIGDPFLTSDLGARQVEDLPIDGSAAMVGRCMTDGPSSFVWVGKLAYWTATTQSVDPSKAFAAFIGDSALGLNSKTVTSFGVWPVRGGQ